LQLCACLAVLGVFFAVNSEVDLTSSGYSLSVAASVIMFVIFALMICFCAPLTFSTEFKADAARKIISFDATVLGCIRWRSVSHSCGFHDVQVC
jgi:hypothetical protein